MTRITRVSGSDRHVLHVRSGSAEVPIYKGRVRGRTRYTIAYYENRRRIRKTFASLAVAKLEARRAAAQIQAGRTQNLPLGPTARTDYLAARALLEPFGTPLVAAVEEYAAARKLLSGAPLLPALHDHIRRTRGIKTGATVPAVVAEFLKSKRQDGASGRYIAQLRSELNRFAAAFPKPILHVKSDEIDDWLRGMDLAPRTRNGMLTSVRTLFSFAKTRSYLPKNDLTEAESLSKVKVGDTDAAIFSPAQLRKVLGAADPDLIPFLAIGAFAGLRAAEIARMDWNAIDLRRRIIEIRAGQAKTASRRIVPVSDNLAAWLRPHVTTGPVIRNPEIYRRVTSTAQAAGIEWPKNVLRHSFISYRIALVKSADQVALEAGNSPAIIFKHYRELATEDQAREWFDIMPATTAPATATGTRKPRPRDPGRRAAGVRHKPAYKKPSTGRAR